MSTMERNVRAMRRSWTESLYPLTQGLSLTQNFLLIKYGSFFVNKIAILICRTVEPYPDQKLAVVDV